MKINVQKYDYKIIDGKLTKAPIVRNFLHRVIINFCLFVFKMINYKHIYNKDEYGRYYVRQIINIRGLRHCMYETFGGQRIQAIFMWKKEKNLKNDAKSK